MEDAGSHTSLFLPGGLPSHSAHGLLSVPTLSPSPLSSDWHKGKKLHKNGACSFIHNCCPVVLFLLHLLCLDSWRGVWGVTETQLQNLLQQSRLLCLPSSKLTSHGVPKTHTLPCNPFPALKLQPLWRGLQSPHPKYSCPITLLQPLSY